MDDETLAVEDERPYESLHTVYDLRGRELGMLGVRDHRLFWYELPSYGGWSPAVAVPLSPETPDTPSDALLPEVGSSSGLAVQ